MRCASRVERGPAFGWPARASRTVGRGSHPKGPERERRTRASGLTAAGDRARGKRAPSAARASHWREPKTLANPSAGVPVPVATETRRSRIVCIARGERPFRYWWLDPVCKHGPRTHADLQVVTPGCDPV